MRRTGQFEAERGDGVGEFVDEDGGVEGDREEERDEVAGGAELGQHAVELAAEDPGDEGGDEEPAGGDVDGHAEGAAHQDAAAGLLGFPGGRGIGEAGGAGWAGAPGVSGGRSVGSGSRRFRLFRGGRSSASGSLVVLLVGVAAAVPGLACWCAGGPGRAGSVVRAVPPVVAVGRLVVAGARLPAPAALVHDVPSFDASPAPLPGGRVSGRWYAAVATRSAPAPPVFAARSRRPWPRLGHCRWRAVWSWSWKRAPRARGARGHGRPSDGLRPSRGAPGSAPPGVAVALAGQ